jgi:hypothetical protein
MGLFLAMSGVIGAEKSAVVAALNSFANSRGGSMKPDARSTNDPNTLVLMEDNLNCSILYPWEFFEWDDASQFLSGHLGVPVFSLHIHDGDLWMCVLYDQGEQVAQFNPLPEYWDDDISEAERASWAGDAEAIAACVPGVSPEAIRPYLRHWNLEEENPGKAFPEDQFNFHDCWQMCDFMKKIKLKYPLDDAGKVMGETYEFVLPEKRN